MPKNNCLFKARWLEDDGLQYAIIALKMSLLPIWKRGCFNVTHERQKARRKVSF